jgi:hypothetical protein
MSGAQSSTNLMQKILQEFCLEIYSPSSTSKAQMANHFSKNQRQAFLAVHAIMTSTYYFDTQLNHTVDELQRVQANVKYLEGTVAGLEGQVCTCDYTISLLKMLAEAPAIHKDPATAPSQSHPPARTMAITKCIPYQDKFSGNCSQLRSFLGQLCMKFIAYHDYFHNKQCKIIYVLSLLDQTVVLIVAPLLDTSVLPCDQI